MQAEQSGTPNTLDADQFRVFMMLAVGAPGPEAEALFKSFDTDGTGSISAAQFVHGAGIYLHGSLDEKLALCFAALDKEGKGYLDADSLFAGLMAAHGHSLEEYDEAVARDSADLLHKLAEGDDGRITAKSFAAGLKEHVELLGHVASWLRTRPDLAEEHTSALTAAFHTLDRDDSGRVATATLHRVARSLHEGGLLHEGARDLKVDRAAEGVLAAMKPRHSGGLDLDEWLTFFARLTEGYTHKQRTDLIHAVHTHRHAAAGAGAE